MSKEAELVLNAFINKAHKQGVIDFMDVTPKSVGITDMEFNRALKELEDMGYIKNIQWCPGGGCLYDCIEIDTPDFKLHE